MHADAASLQARCQRLADGVAGAEVVPSTGAVGGGSAPGVALSGWAVAVPASLAERLRRGRPSVVGRIERDRCLLDLRCIEESDDPVVLAAMLAALG
jgi:L-seryl-tRNA(Ser) seleniumtransferase